MIKEVIYAGKGEQNEGQIIDVKDHPVPASVIQARGIAARVALVRARAAQLRKAGKHTEALSLLSTIGE